MSSPFVFPDRGLSKSDVIARLKGFQATGADWRGGRVPIFVFHADDEVEEVSRTAYDLFFSENAQGVAAFPAIEEMTTQIIQAALGLLNAPEGADGILTSGGTESIFLAVHCAREHARATGRGTPARHNIVLADTGHPAFDKAARYLDITIRRVPAGAGYLADPQAMRDAMDDDTIIIVGSAPAFPHGVFDPLAEISALAVETGTWMHVDACVGGYLAPFVAQLGHPVPDFDFRLPGVHSMSADLHKYGYAAKPASTVLFRSKELADHAMFRFDAWPRGIYRSRTFSGSRPAGAVASAWAVLNFLGNDGYLRHARTVMETRDRLVSGLRKIDGLAIQGDPVLGLFSYGSDRIDIRAVGDGLEDRGWFVPRNARPPGLQFLTMPVHAQIVDHYLADVADAVRSAAEGTGPRDKTVTY